MVTNIVLADPPTPPTLGVGSKVKTIFSESSHFPQINLREWSIEHHTSTHSVLTHTLNLWVGLKGKKSECDHVAYQIK